MFWPLQFMTPKVIDTDWNMTQSGTCGPNDRIGPPSYANGSVAVRDAELTDAEIATEAAALLVNDDCGVIPPAVTSAVIGIKNASHLREAVAVGKL